MATSQKYEHSTEPLHEDQHTLLGNRRISRAPEWSRRSYRLHHILLSIITGAAAAAAVLILTLLVSNNIDRFPSAGKHFYPELPFSSPKTFNEDAKYVNGSWEKEFAKLLPHEHGFIRVPNPHQYSLSGGFPLKDGAESYSISMFHQIHCILALKQDFNDLLTKPRSEAMSEEDMEHANHCFEYLRQALMCAGDLTMEKMRTDEHGRPIRDVIGWGVTHMCKNWDSIIDWADANGDKSVREGEIAGHHLHVGGGH